MRITNLARRLRGLAGKCALWLVAAVLAIGAGLVTETRLWQSMELHAFDLLTYATSPDAQLTPIFIVGIDDESISALGHSWPWPRSIHAKLTDALKKAGAGVIVFDVVFECPSDPSEDEALVNAVRRAGNVVLGASLVQEDTPYGTLQRRQDPLPALVAAGAQVGMVTVEPNRDRVVRRFPDSPDSLWRVTLHALQRRVPGVPVDFQPPKGAYLRYLGRPRTFSYIPYFKALELGSQPGVLDGALVLVGRMAAITTDISSVQADTWATPMTWFTGTVMSGVEIHATAMENAIRGQAIGPLHPAAHWLLLSLVAFGCVFSVAGHKLSTGAAISAGWLLLVAAAVLGLWHYQQIFLPPLAMGAVPVGVYIGRIGVVAHRERQNRLALKRTFSLYLAEPVVEQIAAHPENVELGGEQRQITLLFSDLEGFTTLSERLSPRQIAVLLNEYFELMTQAVFRRGGTLDKFIGDAVMAFWGAPISQEDHAERAVACARDMLTALDGFNARQQARGRPTLRMRIGIHTGEAVVGNLGCPSRFSFTALGDTVNLASRLESANKLQGTRVLISEATKRELPQGTPIRYVDEIQVKGREQAVKVYTLAPEGVSALEDKGAS